MLTPGTRIGAYEVLALVGTGGMGEVYRARDLRLDRHVALKILPETFARDPERLARFEREAKMLAALNHPHIAQIYGIEAPDGRKALVMELVEGETLADRLAKGAMPLAEARRVARQIAEALEAAHEKGIVHRDLKPANVKIGADDTVKVLDFGLAKSSDADAATPHSDTMTSPAVTMQGVILGTAAYMSPEQARGKAVDKRSDIWAFGCVLYEMLTGQLAFAAASVTDTLSAITRDEPDWRLLPPDMPVDVTTLLKRCLHKDVSYRLRDIGEARILLSETRPFGTDAVARASYPGRWWALAAAVALIAALGGYFAGQRRIDPTTPLTTSFAQLTDQPGFERQPTISPDGRSVVFVSDARGNADLYLLRVGGRNTVLLTADSDAEDYAPAFSRDGNRIAFRSERGNGGIFVMDATGESVRRVSDFGFDPHWSPDGTSLVVAEEAIVDPMSRTSQSELWVIDVSTGARRRVASADAVAGKWSPGGRRIAYWARDRETGNRDLYTVASDGSEADAPIRVTNDAWVDWGPTWSPDGALLYFASNRGGTMNLWRVAVDETSGGARGEPEAITTPTAWSGWFEVTADGTRVVFTELDERSTIWTTAFDPAGGEIVGRPRAVLQGLAINSIDLAPGGDKIAFSQRGQPWEALGTIRIDGSGWSRLTSDDVYHRVPMWSPDARRLTFYRSIGIFTVMADGSDLRPVELPREFAHGVYPAWSPTGDRLAVATDAHYCVVDVSASPAKVLYSEPTPPGSTGFLPHSWSPDGRRVAGTNRRNVNRDRIYIRDALSGPARLVTEAGKSPIWLPDSRRLIYSSPTGIRLIDVDSTVHREVLPLPRSELLWGRVLSLSRDGRTLAYLQSQSEGDVWLMTIQPAAGPAATR
jgi:Tol biopolymer transport system component